MNIAQHRGRTLRWDSGMPQATLHIKLKGSPKKIKKRNQKVVLRTLVKTVARLASASRLGVSASGSPNTRPLQIEKKI